MRIKVPPAAKQLKLCDFKDKGAIEPPGSRPPAPLAKGPGPNVKSFRSMLQRVSARDAISFGERMTARIFSF